MSAFYLNMVNLEDYSYAPCTCPPSSVLLSEHFATCIMAFIQGWLFRRLGLCNEISLHMSLGGMVFYSFSGTSANHESRRVCINLRIHCIRDLSCHKPGLLQLNITEYWLTRHDILQINFQNEYEERV